MTESGAEIAALVKEKCDAQFWFTKMAAAAAAAATKEQIVLDPYGMDAAWTRIRMESQKLLELSDDHLAIGENLTKSQNQFYDYANEIDCTRITIKILTQTIDVSKQRKADCPDIFKRKAESKQMDLDYVETKIEMSPFFIEEKASIEAKIRGYPQREAEEMASLDAKIRECEDELTKKMAELKETEQKLAVVVQTFKLTRDALDSCEEAILTIKKVFVSRVWSFKEKFVEVVETADVSTLKRICALKGQFRGLELKFAIGKSVGGCSLEDFCGQIGKLSEGAIVVESGLIYELSIDGEGLMCHFCHVEAKPLP